MRGARDMKGLRLLWVYTVVFAVALLVPRVSSGQAVPPWDFSISGFGGVAIPFETDIDATFVGLPLLFTFEDVELETSASFGGKVGAWWTGVRPNTGLDLGAELDLTGFSPDIDAQTVNLSVDGIPVGPAPVPAADQTAVIAAVNVLARWPINVSAQFPFGRWHPYVGVGGGFETLDTDVVGGGDADDTAAVLQALAGVKVFFTRNAAAFAEYKFTHAEHTLDFGLEKDTLDISATHLVAGFAYHF